MLRRRIMTAHANVFAFLGHLHMRTTEDSQADIARLNRDLAIRRVKKRTNIMNDKRIKISCISRYDSGIHASAVLARCQGGHI